jgi:putative ABC transport system substrate-binding protein
MHRRAFIFSITCALATRPLAATAQQAGKVYRVGLIFTTSPVSEMVGPEPINPSARAFLQGLRALGYVEGQNLILERRSAEGRYERFGKIVAELVRLKADVIVTVGNAMARAAQAVTTTVPIVMAVSSEPASEGLVQNLARPGGNITGLTLFVGPEIAGKRLALLKDAVPGIARVVYFGNKENKEWESPFAENLRTAARALGVTLLPVEYTAHQYTEAFTLISRARADALYVSEAAGSYADRALIVDFATRARLPSTFHFREAAELGGLISYGVNFADVYRRAAGYVDKILKGANPGDLPIEQPTKFELIINLKTAKTLGLTIPQSLLLRADEVIE